MTKTLLIEIGVEELPASFVARAMEQMPELAKAALLAARLTHGEMKALGTPRRLSLVVEGVSEAQPDLEEEVLGPPRAVAFEEDGRPKKAAEGFAKKLGVPLEAVRIIETDKGAYAGATRSEKGQPAMAVLGKIVEAVTKVQFQKTMRWSNGEHAFGRPVQWLVALFGNEVIPSTFVGIEAGRKTRGHRFLAPAEFELTGADGYLDALRKVHVLADTNERTQTMVKALHHAAAEANGELVEDEFLVGENLTLVEEPHVICGHFEEGFLSLPEEVIVAVMRGHQRYFAVRAPNGGALMPRYLCVANTANDPKTILRGNDRVLRARLSDARFFVDEDQKKKLSERVARLDGIVFQVKLGSVGEKVRRVGRIAESSSADPTALETAALAKADLVSLIVGEFPELQGLMGRWYALKEGLDARQADAIRDHYLPKGASDSVPTETLAAHIAVADRIDTLVGCFGVGIIPSGSADPFALRRAMLGVIRIALEGPIDVELKSLVAEAHAAYVAQEKKLAPLEEVSAKLDEFARVRLKGFFGEKNSPDVIEACLAAWDGNSLRDLAARVNALSSMRSLPAFESLAVAFKRAYNISKDATPGIVQSALFDADAERELATAFNALEGRIDERVKAGQYGEALSLIASDLRAPIDRFFTEVFVMVDDPGIRENRLRFLRHIATTLNRIAYFHMLAG